MKKVAKVGWFVIICMFVNGCTALQSTQVVSALELALLAARTVESIFEKYREEFGLPGLEIDVKERLYEYEYATSVDVRFSIEG